MLLPLVGALILWDIRMILGKLQEQPSVSGFRKTTPACWNGALQNEYLNLRETSLSHKIASECFPPSGTWVTVQLSGIVKSTRAWVDATSERNVNPERDKLWLLEWRAATASCRDDSVLGVESQLRPDSRGVRPHACCSNTNGLVRQLGLLSWQVSWNPFFLKDVTFPWAESWFVC